MWLVIWKDDNYFSVSCSKSQHIQIISYKLQSKDLNSGHYFKRNYTSILEYQSLGVLFHLIPLCKITSCYLLNKQRLPEAHNHYFYDFYNPWVCVKMSEKWLFLEAFSSCQSYQWRPGYFLGEWKQVYPAMFSCEGLSLYWEGSLTLRIIGVWRSQYETALCAMSLCTESSKRKRLVPGLLRSLLLATGEWGSRGGSCWTRTVAN